MVVGMIPGLGRFGGFCDPLAEQEGLKTWYG